MFEYSEVFLELLKPRKEKNKTKLLKKGRQKSKIYQNH